MTDCFPFFSSSSSSFFLYVNNRKRLLNSNPTVKQAVNQLAAKRRRKRRRWRRRKISFGAYLSKFELGDEENCSSVVCRIWCWAILVMDIYLEKYVDFGINERSQANVNKKISFCVFVNKYISDKYKHLTPIRDAHFVPPCISKMNERTNEGEKRRSKIYQCKQTRNLHFCLFPMIMLS